MGRAVGGLWQSPWSFVVFCHCSTSDGLKWIEKEDIGKISTNKTVHNLRLSKRKKGRLTWLKFVGGTSSASPACTLTESCLILVIYAKLFTVDV